MKVGALQNKQCSVLTFITLEF